MFRGPNAFNHFLTGRGIRTPNLRLFGAFKRRHVIINPRGHDGSDSDRVTHHLHVKLS